MRRRTTLRAVAYAVLLAACATSTPVNEPARQRTLDAAAVCGKDFPNLRCHWDERAGKLQVTARRQDVIDYHRFSECMRATLERYEPDRSGRLAAMAPTQTVVPVSVERGMILVPILANGNIAGRLIVDTGASITILGPDIVKALRLTVPADAARVSFRLADGRLVQHPIVRLASLRVGDMTVEDLDVALGERSGPGDGLLGQNFLRHFRVSIEPARGRLVLDSLR
jgi:predicted aspartyl protease